jgi:FkbM family methyltransferase
MLISTRTKIAIARVAYFGLSRLRRVFGQGPQVSVSRFGIRWDLDLREGFDLFVYLFGRIEPGTINAYEQIIRPGDVVADVGANMGAHTLWLARCVGPTGRVLAFEPTTDAFHRLRGNIENNPQLAQRIDARQVMLVADPGQPLEPVIYASWPVDGVQYANEHALHCGIPISTAGAKTLTFDEAVEGKGRISLIKLDVDGYELDILQGSQRVLTRDHPTIIMEVQTYIMRERGQNIGELFSLLASYGYHYRHLGGRPASEAELLEVPEGCAFNVIATVD